MIIKSEAMCSCKHAAWRHVLNHEGCYICNCHQFNETQTPKENMFKAILVSKSNHATVRKLTGLDPRHIENKIIVVQEKNPGLGLVEIVQRWVFETKYTFTEQPSPHHLVGIEVR